MRSVEFIRGLGLGGAEALLVNRLSTLEARERGGAVVVNSYPPQSHYGAVLEGLGVEVRPTATGPVRSTLQVWKEATRAGRGAVLVSHSPSTSVVLKARRALGLGRSQVLVDVVHNSTFRPAHHLLGRLLNRYADRAVFVGDEVARSRAARGYGASSVVHGGVPVAEFEEWFARHPHHRDELRARYDVGSGRLLIAVGGLTEVKNHVLAIRTLTLLDPGDHLLIVGEGAERQRLEGLAAELGVTVHLVGSQPQAWQWMGAGDVLLHTSRFEGLPVVLMEAAAQGLPIAATPFEGAAEVAAHAEGVMVADGFEPGDVAAAVRSLPARGRTDRSNSYWGASRFARDFYTAVDLTHREDHQ